MKSGKKKLIRKILLGCVGVGIFLGVWQLLMSMGVISERTMSTPGQVLETFIYKLRSADPDGATLQEHFLSSFKLAMIGFITAMVIGIPMGLVMGYFKAARLLLNPMFEVIRPIPPIAWIPLIILWCGIGETSKVIIVFIGAVVPIVLNTYSGIRQVDPMLFKAAKSVGAGDRATMFEVVLPASLPSIVAGMKTSLSTGWMCVLAAEMVVARQGVGFLIVRGMDSGDSALILSGMVVIGVVSALITALLNRAEVKLCPWRTEQR